MTMSLVGGSRNRFAVGRRGGTYNPTKDLFNDAPCALDSRSTLSPLPLTTPLHLITPFPLTRSRYSLSFDCTSVSKLTCGPFQRYHWSDVLDLFPVYSEVRKW